MNRRPAKNVGTDGKAFEDFCRKEGSTVSLTAKDNFFILPDMGNATATGTGSGSGVDGSLRGSVSRVSKIKGKVSVEVSAPGNGRTEERAESLHLFRQKRKAVWPMREEPYHSAQILHFATDHKRKLRWLAHYYSFLWWEARADELHCKRFARDALRYRDEIFCAAAGIVNALRQEADRLQERKTHSADSVLGQGLEEAPFSTFHIRRGEFQFKAAKVPVEAILQSTGHLLHPGELIYVSTDEEDGSFLDPIREAGFTVRTLADLLPAKQRRLLSNPDWVGMIEQVVASSGRVFVGTYWSTFTAFIVRMRGYKGLAKSSFYALPTYRDVYSDPEKSKERRKGAGWWREWPEAWESIDSDRESEATALSEP